MSDQIRNWFGGSILEVSKRFYIKSKDPLRRLANLKKVAEKYCHGNFSKMVNDAINEKYNLDADTGEERFTLTEKVADAVMNWPQKRKKKP